MDKDFAGKTAVISASGRNLGKEMALIMGRRGANLVLNALSDQAELDGAVKEVRETGAEAIGVLADVSTEEGVARLAGAALARFGKVDILISNAGIRPTSNFLDITYEQWRKVLAVKLESAFLLSKAFLPGMVNSGYGRVIAISGVDAWWGKADKPHLTSANMGLVGLIHSMAVHFAPKGITANVVVPGGFNTIRKHAKQWFPDWEKNREKVRQRIPMGRFGEPAELAEVAVFIASEKASYLTGQTIHVNGGVFPTSSDPFFPV